MRKRNFVLGLFIYAVIVLLLIFAGLFLFWQYIAAYEFSRVDGVMDSYMEDELDNAINREIDRFAAAHESAFESAEDIAAALHSAVDDGELTWRKSPQEYSSDTPVYSVRLDRQELGRVYFRPYSGGPLSFGFDYWFANRAEFDFDGFALEYTVTAPAEATVAVNGVTLNAENCAVSWAVPEELAPYADELAELPSCARYSFTAFSVPRADLPDDSGDYWLSEDESVPNVFTVTQMCPDTELSEQLHKYAEDFVRAYISYTSNAASGPGTVTGYMVYNGALYQRMLAAMDGLSWVHGVTGYISDLSVGSLQYYGCAATLEASYKLTTAGTQTDNNMKIVLTQTDRGWRVAEIELF